MMEASSPTPPPPAIRLSATWPAVEILYEDADLLALNKPAGLLVAPDRWDKSRENLAGLLAAALREQTGWVRARSLAYLANAHRLDRDTSGVMLLAANRAALTNVARQFGQRAVRKSYVALVRGRPPLDSMTIEFKLSPHPAKPGQVKVDPRHGKPAVTQMTVLEAYRGFTLVRLDMLTGRSHQIRVHMQAVGCPLVADPAYGNGEALLLSRIKPGYRMKAAGERPLIGRTALHAEQIALTHPASGRPLTIRAEWPKDLTVSIRYLQRFASLTAGGRTASSAGVESGAQSGRGAVDTASEA